MAAVRFKNITRQMIGRFSQYNVTEICARHRHFISRSRTEIRHRELVRLVPFDRPIFRGRSLRGRTSHVKLSFDIVKLIAANFEASEGYARKSESRAGRRDVKARGRAFLDSRALPIRGEGAQNYGDVE